LAAEEAEEEAERRELDAASRVTREEVTKLTAELCEARSQEAETQEELRTARAQAEDCQNRRQALDEQCANERSKLAEVTSRFRQIQITRPVGQTELRRLQAQLQTLTAQLHAAQQELAGQRERASREEVFS
jgi:chromosome segregation ATPase